MRTRALVILVLLVMILGPLSSALPTDNGPGGQETTTTDSDPIYLYLRAGTFDPLVHEEPVPEWLARDSTNPFYIIQFDGPIQKAWRDAAEDIGVELLDYLPDFGYFAYIPAELVHASAVLRQTVTTMDDE